MLGLGRPLLNRRPSLLELLLRKSDDAVAAAEAGSAGPSSPELGDRHHSNTHSLPLPPQPPQSTTNNSPVAIKSSAATHTMAPEGSKGSGDEQYGSVFSVSGPVIVAENMIGCAMYELVSELCSMSPVSRLPSPVSRLGLPMPSRKHTYTVCSVRSVELDMIRLLEKSSESTRTRQQSRSTRKPV
jgi:hypothetical protein